MTDTTQTVEHGLVCAYELDGRGGSRPLNWQDIDTPAAGPRWIHLDFTQPHAREWLRRSSSIDRIIVDALLDEDSRPRSVRHGKGMLVILRGVNLNPGADPEDMVSIRIWIEKDRVVSTRRRKLLSVARLREAMAQGEGPRDAGDFLVLLTQYLGERITPVIDALDEEVEEAEQAFARNEAVPYSGEFSAFRRQAARIRRYLAPQRDALERLSRDADSLFAGDEMSAFREEADQITRALEDLDLVRERAILAQEELLGRLANEQNRRMYVLSLVAAIFLPLSFLTGLMGMNVAGLPGTEDPAAFALLSLFMIGVAILIVILFRWRKWL